MVECLTLLDGWPVPTVAVAVVRPQGVIAARGDTSRPYRIASVAKLLTAYAVLVAVEEGSVALEDPVAPPGATLAHLLSHASGYGFESNAAALAAPGRTRIYSNRGIEEAAAQVAERAAMPFGDYLAEAVLAPLGMAATSLRGSPAFGVWSTVDILPDSNNSDTGRYVGSNNSFTTAKFDAKGGYELTEYIYITTSTGCSNWIFTTTSGTYNTSAQQVSFAPKTSNQINHSGCYPATSYTRKNDSRNLEPFKYWWKLELDQDGREVLSLLRSNLSDWFYADHLHRSKK